MEVVDEKVPVLEHAWHSVSGCLHELNDEIKDLDKHAMVNAVHQTRRAFVDIKSGYV